MRRCRWPWTAGPTATSCGRPGSRSRAPLGSTTAPCSRSRCHQPTWPATRRSRRFRSELVEARQRGFHVGACLLARGADEDLRLLFRDVPRLGDARAAVDGFELVAPDTPAGYPCERLHVRCPRETAVLLELDHFVHHRVRDTLL